jgi:hypothetical protein
MPLLQSATLEKLGSEIPHDINNEVVALFDYIFNSGDRDFKEHKAYLVPTIGGRCSGCFSEWINKVPTEMVHAVVEDLGLRWGAETDRRMERVGDQAASLAGDLIADIVDVDDEEAYAEAFEEAMEYAWDCLDFDPDAPSDFDYDSKLELAQCVLDKFDDSDRDRD